MVWLRPGARQRFHPERLFRPRSVAVIGAATPAGGQILDNIRQAGFAGALIAVAGDDLAGEEIGDLTAAVDLAVIAAPVADADTCLASLAARGVHAAIVTASGAGFAAAVRRVRGVRVLGPHSFGLAVPGLGLNATRAHLPVPAGRTALISQSASLCRAVLDWAGPNGVGFSHIVGIGSNSDIGFGLTLDWLSRDSATGVILLDIRRLKDPRAFISAARAAARLRPVVAIRAGGRLIDADGTAEAAFAAALRRAGVLSVTRFEDFLAADETLSRAPPPASETLALLTNAFGPGQMAADEARRLGIALAPVGAELRARLGIEPGAGDAAAPLLLPLAGATRLGEGARLLAASPEIGGVIAVVAPSGDRAEPEIASLVACGPALRRPLLVAAMGETTGAAHRRTLAEAGIAVFATPEQAVHGFHHLIRHRRGRAAARELPPSTVVRLLPDRAAARLIFAARRRAGRLSLRQDEALAVLSAYGLPVVPTRVAASPEDAAVAARLLGFPVALKLRRTEKSGAPRVVLDLAEASAVVRAARQMARAAGAGEAAEFLVQRQVGRARELMIAVADDPVFGPTIAFGLGGSAGAIFRADEIDLPPLNLSLARALIARSALAPTLGAFRAWPPSDPDAIAEALVRVSQVVVDFPEIATLTIDPLFADRDGIVAGDAGLTLRPAGEQGRLAIAPYPAELEGIWQGGGETLLIRPIRPEDAEAHGAFFRRLAPEDVRYRFFSPMRELSPEQMARMTQVDYQREIAFIAVRGANAEGVGETVGVARLAREMDVETSEFAIVVQPDWKGRGLASHLMHRLFDWARRQGMREIIGQILADNTPMLAFVKHLGFTLHRLDGEDDVIEARLALVPEPER